MWECKEKHSKVFHLAKALYYVFFVVVLLLLLIFYEKPTKKES